MNTQERWQREVVRSYGPGDVRLVLLLVGDLAGANRLVHLGRAEALNLMAITGLELSTIHSSLRAAEKDGWVRIWTPEALRGRNEDELVVELVP